jgi:hypothetical protein
MEAIQGHGRGVGRLLRDVTNVRFRALNSRPCNAVQALATRDPIPHAGVAQPSLTLLL